jgi:hypothetical protein
MQVVATKFNRNIFRDAVLGMKVRTLSNLSLSNRKMTRCTGVIQVVRGFFIVLMLMNNINRQEA